MKALSEKTRRNLVQLKQLNEPLWQQYDAVITNTGRVNKTQAKNMRKTLKLIETTAKMARESILLDCKNDKEA